MNWLLRLDLAVYHWMRDHEQPVVMYVARDLTSFGGNVGVFVATVFVCGLLALAGEWASACTLGAGVLLAGFIIWGLKVMIGRPCPLYKPYQCCFKTVFVTGPSFPLPHLPCMPSGHTFGSVFLYGLLAHLAIQLWPQYTFWWIGWGYGLPIAIGCTRIILSAHWLTDVVAGFVLGHLLLLGWLLVL